MRFLLCILFSAFLITTLKSAIAKDVYDPTTCGLPGPGFKGNELKTKARNKRDYYSADYNPTAGDETEEDENDPMRTKIMGGERAVKDELPWAAAVKTLKKKSKLEPAANFEYFQIVDNMIPEGDVRTRASVVIGGTCQKVDKKYNCAEEDVVSVFQIKRASYRSFFEYGSEFTHDFAILELTADVPKHIHHICLPHMNKKIDISDSSLRMSSLDGAATGDSGGGITANIGGRTYPAGVVSGGNQCDDLLSGSEKPEAQVNTDVTKYAALIDSWLGAKKPK